tara:strand:+ start:36705 stop:38039 length:1335 start_codon:yes stop_codon:yes gene_type:complete
MKSVGIDGISIWSGKLSLDLANVFAPAVGENPDKYTKGLGLYTCSFPDVREDIVTMGANAAYKLMIAEGVDPSEIGRIDVATESSFDSSKPISTYISGCLEQVFGEEFRNVNKGERKFACIAGTQCIDDAHNWILSGRNEGKSALVIATDTALYERGNPGEATQGAGAVAMLISEDPSIMELSLKQGYSSVDETDFLKPNQQFPSVDGKRSVQVYLSLMRNALMNFEERSGKMNIEEFQFVPFHVPFPGMVRKAASLGYRYMTRGTPIENELEKLIGPKPEREKFSEDEKYTESIREYMKLLEGTEVYKKWYKHVIEPTVQISSKAGNWYTGSVHLARASSLLHAESEGLDLVDKKILVGSYGSGAQAEIHVETIKEGWEEKIKKMDIYSQLDSRRSLSFEEYEQIHDVHNYSKEIDLDELTNYKNEFICTGYGKMGENTYEFV